uniref:Uncharacterized protein n=1 Tax=Plectus sambesii TaxID=2011161 RepID=A0A914VKC2_9BILA
MITVYTEQDVPKNYMSRQYQPSNNGHQYQTGNNGYQIQQQYVYDTGMMPAQQEEPNTSKGRKFVIIFGAAGCCILVTLVAIFVLMVILNNWGYLR